MRHDYESQYVARDFQRELAFLGIEGSPAFVRAPEDILRSSPRTSAERFVRALKENLLWVRTFGTVEGLRQALLAFRERYNRTWIAERLGYRTPIQVRAEQLQPVALAAARCLTNCGPVHRGDPSLAGLFASSDNSPIGPVHDLGPTEDSTAG